MKKQISILAVIATLASCSKSSDTENCTWTNSYLAGKTYKTTKVEAGTGSVKDSTEQFMTLSFTADSVNSVTLNRNPNISATIAYTASTVNGINILTTSAGTIYLTQFNCTEFTYYQKGKDSFILTMTKQ